jgi:hypothetical protein
MSLSSQLHCPPHETETTGELSQRRAMESMQLTGRRGRRTNRPESRIEAHSAIGHLADVLDKAEQPRGVLRRGDGTCNLISNSSICLDLATHIQPSKQLQTPGVLVVILSASGSVGFSGVPSLLGACPCQTLASSLQLVGLRLLRLIGSDLPTCNIMKLRRIEMSMSLQSRCTALTFVGRVTEGTCLALSIAWTSHRAAF